MNRLVCREQLYAIPAFLFGTVERLVSGSNEFGHRLDVNSRGCNSKAGRNRSIWPRGVLQGGTESLCGYRSLKETAALENDSKFFSAVTGGQLVAARILPHDIGDPSHCLVPGLVTKLIVKALEFSPEDPFITDSLGWVEYRLGNTIEALAILERAYASKTDPEIAAHLGEVMWVLKKNEDAIRTWDEGLSKNQNNEVLLETIKRLKTNH